MTFNSLTERMQLESKTDSAQEAGRIIAWYDATLDAKNWVHHVPDIKPREAAMLLCQFNPGDNLDPNISTNDETGPDDFRRLLRVFEGVANTNPKLRTLLQWRDIARERKLKYHSWIDKYAEAIGAVDATTLSPATEAATDDKLSISPECEVFRKMSNLDLGEISITLLANNLLEISARNETRRMSLGTFGFIDSRTGIQTRTYLFLLKLAKGETLTADGKEKGKRTKTVSDLRKLLKAQLGFEKDPFFRYRDGEGYRVRFQLADKHNAADERAKQNAKRRTDQFDDQNAAHLQAASSSQEDYPFAEEDDPSKEDIKTSEFLKRQSS